MQLKRWMMAALLLAVVATTGCGFRRASYRRPYCEPAPALLPAVPVPVTAAAPPCCCP